MVVFDNSDVTSNLSDPSVGSNRYLLLDLLGSLPTTADGKRIKLSIISFADEPDLLVTFNDNQKRDAIFRKVEGIEPEHGKPKYAKALNFALEEYEKSRRADARGILLIVGDGRAEDTDSERNAASKNLRKQGKLSCFAVDSGKSIDQKVLSEYTGSADRVYNYDKNAEFAKKLLAEVAGPNCIKRVRSDSRSAEKSSEKSLGKDLLRDIGSRPDNTLKQFEGEKVIVKAKNIVAPTLKRITPRPTVASSRRSSTRPSRPVSSTPRSASKRLTTKSPLADSKSKQLTRKQSLTSRLPTVARAKIFSSTTRTPSTRQPSTASQQTTKLSTKPSVAELKTTSRPRTTLKSIITSRITPQFTRRPTNKTTVAITSRFTTRPTTTRLTTRLTTPRPTTPTRSPTPTAKPFSSR
ncbi:unnamed protein product, partial [Anisakis simplex]|uniref:VWFA domain-containing protein n=1 Tax=Anisakis simplex TaxID=6269 RepID=A0A0M3KE75_ANISI